MGDFTINLGVTPFPPTSDSILVHCGRVSEEAEVSMSVTTECIVPVKAKFIYVTADIMSAGPLVICDISIDLTGRSSGLIPAWISNYNGYNVWVVEIAYPFSNFKGAVVEAWECNK